MKYQLKRYTGVLRSLVLSLGLFLCTSNDSLMHSNASVLALPMIEKYFCVELHEEQFKWFNTVCYCYYSGYMWIFYEWQVICPNAQRCVPNSAVSFFQ